MPAASVLAAVNGLRPTTLSGRPTAPAGSCMLSTHCTAGLRAEGRQDCVHVLLLARDHRLPPVMQSSVIYQLYHGFERAKGCAGGI